MKGKQDKRLKELISLAMECMGVAVTIIDMSWLSRFFSRRKQGDAFSFEVRPGFHAGRRILLKSKIDEDSYYVWNEFLMSWADTDI
jgi:hypothetical protein